MYYSHGAAPLFQKVDIEECFDFDFNICNVFHHALLCKVLPDNCTCVNTLNTNFVLKKTWINAMIIVHLKSVCIIY